MAYIVHLGPDILLDDPANNNPSAFNSGVLGTIIISGVLVMALF
jgi:hypothetical protein